jgi:hypothetical protein
MEEIQIELLSGEAQDQIGFLKQFIENQEIEGIEKLEIQRETANRGMMGSSLENIIKAVIAPINFTAVLEKLIEVLHIRMQNQGKKIDNEQQEIKITTKKGDKEFTIEIKATQTKNAKEFASEILKQFSKL